MRNVLKWAAITLADEVAFSGGSVTDTLPEVPLALNPTPIEELQSWTFEAFIAINFQLVL